MDVHHVQDAEHGAGGLEWPDFQTKNLYLPVVDAAESAAGTS